MSSSPGAPTARSDASQPIRVVTAASLFDGHDAAINIMRRILQAQGAEVIHLEAIQRMDRALREFRIRGVRTNLAFLETLLSHAKFRGGDYTTRFIDETPELFHFAKRRDRATRLLRFIGDAVLVAVKAPHEVFLDLLGVHADVQ